MTTQHRDVIWDGLLDAERLDRYYDILGLRFRAKHVAFNIYVSIALTVSAVALLSEWADWIPSVLFVSSSLTVTVSHYAEFSRKSGIAFRTSRRYRELGMAWRRLWREQDAPDASARVFELSRQINEITEVDFKFDEKLDQRCAKEAYEECRSEFATRNLQTR